MSQQDLLDSLRKNLCDICAIQEPYIDFQGQSRANGQWYMIYPPIHSTTPKDTRSILLINTNLLTNVWKQIPIEHPDITAVKISGNFGKLWIFNIYNTCQDNDALKHLSLYMQDNPPNQSIITPTEYIWLGDFNRHHPLSPGLTMSSVVRT